VAGCLFAAYTASVGGHVADVGLRAFPAVLVGGLDSMAGSILGGVVVGVVEQVGAGEFGTEWRNVISFGILFVVIIVRQGAHELACSDVEAELTGVGPLLQRRAASVLRDGAAPSRAPGRPPGPLPEGRVTRDRRGAGTRARAA
jgi:hypothetical protein